MRQPGGLSVLIRLTFNNNHVRYLLDSKPILCFKKRDTKA